MPRRRVPVRWFGRGSGDRAFQRAGLEMAGWVDIWISFAGGSGGRY